MGRWIEIQLPDDVEERQFKDGIFPMAAGTIPEEEDRLSGIEDLDEKIEDDKQQ